MLIMLALLKCIYLQQRWNCCL